MATAAASASATAAAASTTNVWDLAMVQKILLMTLHLLNWFTLALAVISTIAVGVYYISGFMKEGNVKTAKTLLAVTYTGLAIVLLARLIIEGPTFIITGNKVFNGTDISTDISKPVPSPYSK